MPERETFSGQGGRYLGVLVGSSVLLMVGFYLLGRYGGRLELFRWTQSVEWHWLVNILVLAPLAIGLYYWTILRNEEITVTDEYIYRRSHWGNEKILWHELCGVKELVLLPRQTNIGRVSWFSRFFRDNGRTSSSRFVRYELAARADSGQESTMCIEPSTIDDVDWLLELIVHKASEYGITVV